MSQEIENLKQTILREYPRLTEADSFQFECGAHLECFNRCCADVNIFLTPYDVLRLRRALSLGSAQFLTRRTVVPFDKNQNLPVPLLMMNDTDSRECPFVDPKLGCTVYADRPWPCRMYPLGVASPNQDVEPDARGFYFMMREDFCLGLNRPKQLTIADWLLDQGITPYHEFGELFKKLTLDEAFSKGVKLSPQQIDMYWTALYDLDRFRRFVLESSFLKRFTLDEVEVAVLKSDDEALLRLGFRWLDLALFKKRTLEIKESAAGAKPANRVPKNA